MPYFDAQILSQMPIGLTCLVGLGKRTVYGNAPNERCVLFVMDVSLLAQW